MLEVIIYLAISGFIFLMGIAIKYFKAYFLIAGYNTSSKEEQQYMAEKGIGDFMGQQLMIIAAAPLIGLILDRTGFIWGTEVGAGLLIILVFYTVIAAQRFAPPSSFYSSGKVKRKASNSKTIIIALVISTVVFIGVFGIVFWTSQPTEFTLEQNELKISGAYGTVIPYSDIENLELSETIPKLARRTNGLGMGSIQKGHFKTEDMGDALLFMRSRSGPVIIIQREGEKMVMINFAEPEETGMLYQQLKANVDR